MPALSAFPTITNSLLQKLGFSPSPYRFIYLNTEGEEFDLTDDGLLSNLHPLIDEHGRWSPDSHGFGLSRYYALENSSVLFGKEGICCHDAVLGLALIWKSSDSRQRSSVYIGEIPCSSKLKVFTLNETFPKPIFRGRLDLESVIFIRKAGYPLEDEKHLANIPGTIVGVLDSYSILFDGSGSAFPVTIENNKDGLLWSISCEFDDPLTDRFNESVSINLNCAHPDYQYIDPNNKKYNPSFLREILASALSTLVDQIREGESWDDIKNGMSEEGSVGQAIYYFSKTLELNLDDAYQCSIAFRSYFEQKLKAI